MKKENITVLRKILYAVEAGGQVYGNQNYGAFAGVGANTDNEKAITIGAGHGHGDGEDGIGAEAAVVCRRSPYTSA